MYQVFFQTKVITLVSFKGSLRLIAKNFHIKSLRKIIMTLNVCLHLHIELLNFINGHILYVFLVA